MTFSVITIKSRYRKWWPKNAHTDTLASTWRLGNVTSWRMPSYVFYLHTYRHPRNMTVIVSLWGQVLRVTIFWLNKLMMWAIPSWIKVMVNHYLPHFTTIWYGEPNSTTPKRQQEIVQVALPAPLNSHCVVTIFPHFVSTRMFAINHFIHMNLNMPHDLLLLRLESRGKFNSNGWLA